MNNCKSCGADIFWALTEKNKRMPIDREPVLNGNLIVDQYNTVHVVKPDPEISNYVSHYASCPFARKHRESK